MNRLNRSLRHAGTALLVMAAISCPQFLTPAAAMQSGTQQGYSLAFVDADAKRVVDAVLGSMLGANYDIDPAIKGNVTLRTSNPVPASQLVPLLERALAPIDAVIVRQGNSYRVLPRSKARALSPVSSPAMASGPAVGTGKQRNDLPPSAPGFASEAISLRHASADSIVKLAEELVGKDIVSSGTPGANEVVISGGAEERDAAKKLIARFDVDSLAAMNFEIWKLEDVDPETVVAELKNIFQSPYDIIGSRVRLVPLPRLRSILAIAANRSDLTRIEPWIRRLDNGGSAKRKLYNYSVQNGRARDIAKSLQQVMGPGGGFSFPAPQASNNDQPAIVGATQPDGSGASPPAVQTVSAPNQGFFEMGETRIVPNEQNNSLLIYANGENYLIIKEALEKLDQPVAQVLIEATLAEVTLTDDLRFGIDFQTLGSSGSANINVTNSNTGSAVPTASFPGSSVSLIGNSVTAILNTLQSKTNVRVLSAPKLLTLNNQTATLQVGDQVPIVTQQAQGVVSPGAPLVNTIELRDTGVILQVTPRVNDNGIITLDISQEVSDVSSTTTSGINSPTIQQRRLTSTVATKSGQIVMLGGLIRNRQTKEKAGIPLLSQIPIIGGLFGRDVTTGSRTELIILITPTVIRSPDEIKRAVDAVIDGLDLTRPLVDEAQSRQTGPAFEAGQGGNPEQ